MATHFWLFPWLALTAGIISALLAWLSGDRTGKRGPRVPPRGSWILWFCVIAGAIAAGLKLGATAGFDFLAARGLLLGALGGLPLVFLARRAGPEARPALLLGIGTAVVAAGRLWLTHAEISGLAALALGTALTVLCLGVAPAVRGGGAEADEEVTVFASTLGLLYTVSLASASALGFLRAHTLGDMFWADIPLLLGGGLSVGLAVGMGWVRRGPTLVSLLLPPVIAALLVLLLLSSVTHVGRLAGLLALGLALFVMQARLSVRSSPEDKALGGLIGVVMIVAGATLAFALSSGYGLGLFVLGGWLAAGLFFSDAPAETTAAPLPRLGAMSALSFTSLLLVYRLGVLQDNVAARASGPGDTWDLMAICLGAFLPLLAAEWAWRDAAIVRLPSWAVTLLWTLSLALPALFLDYIWQPRSVAGLLLGAALGQLLSGLNGDAAQGRRRFASTALSGAILALVLFLFLPALGHVDAPSRAIRLVLVIVGTVLVLVRVFLPAKGEIVASEGRV